MKNTILAVDDEACNLFLLQEILEEDGFIVETAINGTIALKMLRERPTQYTTILLDRMMPDLSGMEVLKKLKSNDLLKNIPVIFQTALSQEQDVLDGLNAGAYSYVTKPFQSEELLIAMVRSAVEDFLRFAQIQESVSGMGNTARLIDEATFLFQTHGESKDIALYLSKSAPVSRKVERGLIELLYNAVEHGNLGIQYAEKSKLIIEKKFKHEIIKRLALPEFCKRKASIHVKHTSEKIVYTIKDQGEGFKWEEYMEVNPSHAFDPNGRGIHMSKMFYFDTLQYFGSGNELVATVLLTNEQS